MDRDQATCIECGCDDNHACRSNGCFWLRVDYRFGWGVCSQCGSRVADWDRGHPTPSELGIWIKNIRSLRKTNTQTKRLVEMGILPNPDDHP